VLVLVVNESKRFRLRLPFKFALLGVCCCPSPHPGPGRDRPIGMVVFLLDAGRTIPWPDPRRIRIHASERSVQASRQIVVPFGLVLIAFLTLYLFRLIPPVPLSIPFIGVYHGVERTEAGYRLTYEPGSWRFWRRGDQYFRAQPGDRVYVFFRIFSPARFSDQVTMRWYWRPEGKRWELQDSIPIDIVAGASRAFAATGSSRTINRATGKSRWKRPTGARSGGSISSSTACPKGRECSRRICSSGQRAITTCVRDRMCGANWYQPRMAWNSGVATAAGLSSS
jgi:hypothetical protein